VTEPELLALLDCHDRLVKSCLSGDISIEQFLEHYDNFPLSYAMDGHESSEAERALLESHRERVQFHFGVLESLRGLCREEDAAKPEYLEAGHFGRAEGFRRLQQFCETWPRKMP
jgi:hypothetical protein